MNFQPITFSGDEVAAIVTIMSIVVAVLVVASLSRSLFGTSQDRYEVFRKHAAPAPIDYRKLMMEALTHIGTGISEIATVLKEQNDQLAELLSMQDETVRKIQSGLEELNRKIEGNAANTRTVPRAKR